VDIIRTANYLKDEIELRNKIEDERIIDILL
jgi:hypothetical protein